MEPIISEGVRILRPYECRHLIGGIPMLDDKTMFKTLLYTGMRYKDCKRLKKHPEWFNGDGIKIPSLKMRIRQGGRLVRLNDAGKTLIPLYLGQGKSLPPCRLWRQCLHHWADNASVDPVE